MTKGKILFYVCSGLVLLIIAGALYHFNQEFFQQKQIITIFTAKEIKTPELAYYWHFLIVFAIGFLVREFFRVVTWIGKRKDAKELNRKVRMQQDKITALENELELIRGGSGMADYAEAPRDDGQEIVYSKEGA